MNKIEIRSNTEFSQPYCSCLGKRGFVGHQTGIMKNTQYKERKEKPNVFMLHRNDYKSCLWYLDPGPKQEQKTNGLDWKE